MEGAKDIIEEIRNEVRTSKRATELFGIVIIIRLLIVFVITPVLNKTWNRKNSFDVSFFF